MGDYGDMKKCPFTGAMCNKTMCALGVYDARIEQHICAIRLIASHTVKTYYLADAILDEIRKEKEATNRD